LIQGIRDQRKYDAAESDNTHVFTNYSISDDQVNSINQAVHVPENQEHASTDPSWNDTIAHEMDDLVVGNSGNLIQILPSDLIDNRQLPYNVGEGVYNVESNNTGHADEDDQHRASLHLNNTDHANDEDQERASSMRLSEIAAVRDRNRIVTQTHIVNNTHRMEIVDFHLDNESLSSGFADSSDAESEALGRAELGVEITEFVRRSGRIESNIITQDTEGFVATIAHDIDSEVRDDLNDNDTRVFGSISFLEVEGESNYDDTAQVNMDNLSDQIPTPNGMTMRNVNNLPFHQGGNESVSSGFADSSLEEVDGFGGNRQNLYVHDHSNLLTNASQQLDTIQNHREETYVNQSVNSNSSGFVDSSQSGMYVLVDA
jgi:hypothetical protein